MGGTAPLLRGNLLPQSKFTIAPPRHVWRQCRPRPNAPATFRRSSFTVFDPFTGQPFDSNRIPASRIDATGAAIAALLPVAAPLPAAAAT